MNEIFVTKLWTDIDEYEEAVGLVQDPVIWLQFCHCWIRIIASCFSGKDLTDDFTDKPISKIFYYQHKT